MCACAHVEGPAGRGVEGALACEAAVCTQNRETEKEVTGALSPVRDTGSLVQAAPLLPPVRTWL